MSEQEIALRLELTIAIRELAQALREFMDYLKKQKEAHDEFER